MPFPQTKAAPCYQAHQYFPCMQIELICTCQMPETYRCDMVECYTCGDWYQLKCVGLEQFPAEGEQWNGKSDRCVVHKGAITEVIIVYNLNTRRFLHGDANSLGNFAWG